MNKPAFKTSAVRRTADRPIKENRCTWSFIRAINGETTSKQLCCAGLPLYSSKASNNGGSKAYIRVLP